jgi:hypothetical protein
LFPHDRQGELMRSPQRASRQDSIGHWEPLGLDILIHAVDILGSEINRPWHEYKHDRERTLEEVRGRVTADTENAQKRLQRSTKDQIPPAANTVRTTASRKAKKRGNTPQVPPLGTEVPKFFLYSKNPVLAGVRFFFSSIRLSTSFARKPQNKLG